MADRKYQLFDPTSGRWVAVSKEQYDAAMSQARGGSATTSSNQTRTQIPSTGGTWNQRSGAVGGNSFSSTPSFPSGGNSFSSSVPGYGTSTYGTDGMMEGEGSGWGWLGDVGGWFAKQLSGIDAGDILSAGGAAVGGYLDSKTAAAALAQREREFQRQLEQRKAEMGMSGEQFEKTLAQRQAEEATRSGEFGRTTGNTEAQLAVQAETALNKAPMADKAQALLLSRMGVVPQTFQPRDLTKGTASFRAGPTGGSSNVTSAMQNAASAYKPGAGGVDTSALKLLRQRMLANTQPPVPPVPPSPTRPSGVVPRQRPRVGNEPIIPEESPLTVPQVRAPRPSLRPYY